MDRIEKYRKIIEKVFRKIANIKIDKMPLIKSELIIDKQKNHFILVDIGNDEKINLQFMLLLLSLFSTLKTGIIST